MTDKHVYINGIGYSLKGGHFVKSIFASFLKMVCFKRNEFAPPGGKFFPSKVDPFLWGYLVCRNANKDVT